MENGSFAFVQKDTSGRSPGYDVRDAAGVVWSVKLGHEAQSEVVSSRLLWAIGFHQPPTYYISSWTLTGTEAGPQSGGRFRPEIDEWKSAGEWKWEEYPHAATAANAGLLVAQMMINNWDLKNSNNKMIERAQASPPRLYLVRDLGASLGSNEQAKWVRWTQLRFQQGTKNDVEGFEDSGFIEGVEDGYVKFSYSGPNKSLVSRITPAHVRWTSQLMSRLSDKQWQDAFRAGGYPPEDATRFIAKFKAKIAQGLALAPPRERSSYLERRQRVERRGGAALHLVDRPGQHEFPALQPRGLHGSILCVGVVHEREADVHLRDLVNRTVDALHPGRLHVVHGVAGEERDLASPEPGQHRRVQSCPTLSVRPRSFRRALRPAAGADDERVTRADPDRRRTSPMPRGPRHRSACSARATSRP